MFSEGELAQDIMQRSHRGTENLIVKTLSDGNKIIGDTDKPSAKLLNVIDPSREDREILLHRLTGAIAKSHIIEKYLK